MKKITIVALSALCVLAFAACDKKGGSSAAAKKPLQTVTIQN